MIGVDTLIHRLCFHPSFAEKAQGKRVGFQNEGSAPGEDGDEPPELAVRTHLDAALAEKVRAITSRTAETA